MDNNIHNLLRRIQDLEDGHAHLKQQMLNLAVSRRRNQTTLAAAPSSIRQCPFRRHSKVKKLTEAQYFNILQSIDEPIHITDAKGCIVYRNRAWEKFYGYNAAETLGKDVIELMVEAKDAAVGKLIVEQMLKGDTWSGEFVLRNKKGEKFLSFGVSKPFRDENGAVIGIIGVSGFPRPYQEINDEPSIRAPTRIDPHQPSQSDLATEINKGYNCVYHEKDKSGDDHKDALSGGEFSSVCQEEGKSMTCSSDYNKHSIRKILSTKAECIVKNGIVWPWKGNKSNGSRFNSKTARFCWHWLHSDQEHEFVLQMNSVIPAKVASRPWVNTNTTLGLLSSSLDRVDEIKWDEMQIRERLGRGSRGTVYHAVWCGSEVALKLFSKNEYSDDLILSFKQEVYLMKKLRHPNIILFMGAVTSPQHLCIVTEFLHRGSLFQLLHRNTVRLKWRRRVHMAMDIARGMNYLHHFRPLIIHCDLKSTNLLVDKNWTVKIGDFGMCRLKHETYVTTKEGIGAPEWMAPEVLRDEEANEKSDVYSFGVILWELATEKIPWDGLSSMQVMKAVGFMNQRLDIPKYVDPQWASLIERCLHSIPESRPTFQDILAELKDLQRQFAVHVEASTPPLHDSTAKGVCKYENDA